MIKLTWPVILMSLLVVVALSACNEGSNKSLSGTPGNGGIKAGTDNQKLKKPSKPDEKNANIRKQIMRGLQQSDQVYTEVFRVAYGSLFSSGKSIFKALLHRLQRHGFALKQGYEPNFDECPLVARTLSENKNGDSIDGYSLTERKCGDNQESNAVTIKILSNGFIELEFNPAEFIDSIGTAQYISVKSITCQMLVQANGKLQQLICKNLGKSLTNSMRVHFEKFEYDLGNKDIVELDAKIYQGMAEEMCNKKEYPCRKMVVPMAGKIQIFESPSEDVEKLNADLKDKPTPTTVAPANPADISGANNGEIQNQQQNQNPQQIQNQQDPALP